MWVLPTEVSRIMAYWRTEQQESIFDKQIPLQ